MLRILSALAFLAFAAPSQAEQAPDSTTLSQQQQQKPPPQTPRRGCEHEQGEGVS